MRLPNQAVCLFSLVFAGLGAGAIPGPVLSARKFFLISSMPANPKAGRRSQTG